MEDIVIVGGSFAGHAAANILCATLPADFRIVLIDANDFATHLPAIVRALVVPGTEGRNLTAPLRNETVFPERSRHRVVHARVLSLGEDRVKLDRDWEGSDEVHFAKCILATGAWQAPPVRPGLDVSCASYLEALRSLQSSFAAAEHVLIVGGGASGVEVAGEISTHYPSKRVSLVHSHNRLLITRGCDTVPTWVSERIHAQLAARGVEVHLSARVREKNGSHVLSSGVELDADYTFWAVGNRPNSGLLSADHLASDGTIIVDDEFRTRLPNVYAVGDCASTAGRKTAGLAKLHGDVLGKIILAHLAGKSKSYRAGVNEGILVPLGDGRPTSIPGDGIGAGVLDFGWLGKWGAPAWLLRWFARDYWAKMAFASMFKGSEGIGFE